MSCVNVAASPPIPVEMTAARLPAGLSAYEPALRTCMQRRAVECHALTESELETAGMRYFERRRFNRHTEGAGPLPPEPPPTPLALSDFLADARLSQYAELFESECGMVWADISYVTETDLKHIGVKATFHRKRFLRCVRESSTSALAPCSSAFEQLGRGSSTGVLRTYSPAAAKPGVSVQSAPTMVMYKETAPEPAELGHASAHARTVPREADERGGMAQRMPMAAKAQASADLEPEPAMVARPPEGAGGTLVAQPVLSGPNATVLRAVVMAEPLGSGGVDAPPVITRTGSECWDRYERGESLGRGSYGEVVHARDRKTGKRVAIKIVLPTRGGKFAHEERRRLEREAKAAARVKHRFVCECLDWYCTSGTEFCHVLELVEGSSMDKLLQKEGPMRESRAVHIMMDVLEGIAAVHDAGMMHRDLKLENIMIMPNGTPKVIDFGLVKALDAGPALGHAGLGSVMQSCLTMEDTLMGTPEYMSPEQWKGSKSASGPLARMGWTACSPLASRLSPLASCLLPPAARLSPPACRPRAPCLPPPAQPARAHGPLHECIMDHRSPASHA